MDLVFGLMPNKHISVNIEWIKNKVSVFTNGIKSKFIKVSLNKILAMVMVNFTCYRRIIKFLFIREYGKEVKEMKMEK